jgi:hypothetical protein
MTFPLRAALGLLIGVGVLVSPAAAQQKTGGGRYALLVGCTFYENLEKDLHLDGPANDVVMLRGLLSQRFQFPDANIVTLSEAEGKKDPKRVPTRANIERECKRIAALAKEGDQVVVAMGGHGSRMPQENDADGTEIDGFEKIFLPRDVGKWDGGLGAVPNAIRGREIGAWLRPIPEKKALLWVVIDACHSGGGIRGTDEKPRQVSDAALGVPEEAVKKAEQKAAARQPEKTPAREESPLRLGSRDGVVIFYACQSSEVTLEKRLPPDSADKKPFGLLSFTMTQALTQAQKPLTYRELSQRIQDQYVSWGRTFPTPLIEGKDQDRQVLGTAVYPKRALRLVRGEDSLKLNAGEIHSLTEGTIVAVYPPPGAADPDKLLGHVRIKELGTLDSEIEPVTFQKTAAPKLDALPLGGRCEVAFLDFGPNRLKLAVDPLDNTGKKVSEELERGLGEMLHTVAKSGGLFEAVADPAKADWLLRGNKGVVYLVPAAGLPGGNPSDTLPPLFGPYTLDEKLTPTLEDHLGRIVRARNLARLATRQAAAVPGEDAVKIGVETWLFRDKKFTKGQPIVWPDPNLTLFNDDLIEFRFHNPNRHKIDLTVLYVDSGYGVSCLYPRDGELNRLDADRKATARIRVTAKTVGMEHLIVIATKAQGAPVDFASLAQPTLAQAQDKERDRGIAGDRGLSSPLGQLFRFQLYGDGTHRGAEPISIEEHALVLRTFHIRPTPRPAPE